MLSRQIYTPNCLENVGKDVSSFTFEDKSLPDNPQIPTTLCISNVLEKGSIEKFALCETKTPNVVSSGLPQNKIKYEIETLDHKENTTAIPFTQYALNLSCDSFDPIIVNTPPSEFINQLKSRLDVYYSRRVDTGL